MEQTRGLKDPKEISIPEDVRISARQGHLTFFIGNGVSRLYGIPSWLELADKMLQKLADKNVINYSTLDILGRHPTKTKISITDYYFKKALKEQTHPDLTYESILMNGISNEDISKNPIYKLIANCGVRFITTNYDRLLAEALLGDKTEGEVIKPTSLSAQGNDKNTDKKEIKNDFHIYGSLKEFQKSSLLENRVLVHLHGSLNDESELIASTEQYLNLYGDKEMQEKLWLLFRKQTIVFMGYGLEELEILDLIVRSSRLAGHQEQEKPKFFILLPILSHEAKILDLLDIYYQKQLGLTLIPFSRDKDGYHSLTHIVERWSKELVEIVQKPSRVDTVNLLDELLVEFDRAEATRNKKDVVLETLKIVKDDEKNALYFFSNLKSPEWFLFLKDEGFFKESTIPPLIRKENGFQYPAWPQLTYLELLGEKIAKGEVHENEFIKTFKETLIGIKDVKENVFIASTIFKSLYRLPIKSLEAGDIDFSFNLLTPFKDQNTWVETSVHESFFALIKKLENNTESLGLIQPFIKQLFQSRASGKKGMRKSELLFFRDHTFKQFAEKLELIPDFVLEKMLSAFDQALNELLEKMKLDDSTAYWRPAVQDHPQNDYHDSAQSLYVGLMYRVSSLLMSKGNVPALVSKWSSSELETFNRIYFALVDKFPGLLDINEAACTLIGYDLQSRCRHELFHFLEHHFGGFNPKFQDLILDKINSIEVNYDSDNRVLHTAWEKLRWVQALKHIDNARIHELYTKLLVITDGNEADHPDFSSYMSSGWYGTTSPWKIEDFARASPQEILDMLFGFEKSDEFRGPTVEGLSNILEEFIAAEPVKSKFLLKHFEKLKHLHVNSILDGYTKCWDNKKFVPVLDVLNASMSLISSEIFKVNVKNTESKSVWAASAICRFIEAGTRNDENAFPPEFNPVCFDIVKELIGLVGPDPQYLGSSDFYTRAINEPRGKIFETLIVLSLRRARLLKKGTPEFNKVFDQFIEVIGPVLEIANSDEVSLYAQIGSHYRQLLYLNDSWLFSNIDLVVPSKDKKPELWLAFMEGFSYVTAYVKDIYALLNKKQHLLNFLRLSSDQSDKNSRRDNLQERVVELALVSYVLGDESLDNGLLAEIIKSQYPVEWYKMIWSIVNVIGEKPDPSHLDKAKILFSHLYAMRESNPDEFKEHFKGSVRLLKVLNDPSDPLVNSVLSASISTRDGEWDYSECIEYLHEYKDSYPKVVASLFLKLVKEAKVAPAWPEKEIREICSALIAHSEREAMVQVCQIYSAKTVSGGPIRQICETLR